MKKYHDYRFYTTDLSGRIINLPRFIEDEIEKDLQWMSEFSEQFSTWYSKDSCYVIVLHKHESFDDIFKELPFLKNQKPESENKWGRKYPIGDAGNFISVYKSYLKELKTYK
ncbi:MAG: hypothetical protein FWE36_04845 [Erysipelotrichales bacterium]|nr:hypothetical protein [Erysipelotrichales bacterium]